MSDPASTNAPLIDLNDEHSAPPTTSTLQTAKDSVINTASSVMDAASNHPATQQVKDAVVNGPVGQTVASEKAKTTSEFQDLADSRKTPTEPAATGQPLTHYHSLFYRLLSWKNPRATGITFASLVALIFASRYIDVLRYGFRALYSVLGITALAEISGKVTLGNGFATQLRPKKYFTIRKESLERFLDDVEQLINFVVIEFQRILFAENIWVTVSAFFVSFLSYWLIKWVPLWGLTLLGVCCTFLGPLVYLNNKELIDEHLNNAGSIINEQTNQIRDLTAKHTQQATEQLKSYAGDYAQKAQDLIGQARGQVNGTVKSSDLPTAPKTTASDLPTAPKSEPVATSATPAQ